MGQLGRILLSESSGSPDEQNAAVEDGGGYGELMEQIDQLTDDVRSPKPDQQHEPTV